MEKYNVILITVDSLRADIVAHCSSHGSWANTPRFDEFSENRIAFRAAIAQGPYTTTSIPSMLTGVYPLRLKPIPSSKIAGVLPDKVPTLARWLKRAGYHTAAFHSNPFLSRMFGYQDGFDVFYDDLVSASVQLPGWMKEVARRAKRVFRLHPYLPASGVNRLALTWLREVREPFFIWLHYMDPHGPYQFKKGIPHINKVRDELLWRKAIKRPEKLTPRDVAALRSAYQEEVTYLARHFRELAFTLKEEMNLLNRSLVVLTSDHGDGFGEHGFFTHPHELYEELIHVPLIIHVPGVHSRSVDHPVGLVNILPTVLDYAGISYDSKSLEGRSLRPLMERGELGELPDYVISEAELNPYIGAVRMAQWKFILNQKRGTKELYNLREDPGESHNVLRDHPALAEGLEQILVGQAKRDLPRRMARSRQGRGF